MRKLLPDAKVDIIRLGIAMPEIDHDIWKQAVKEALTEWLDDKFITLGKWSLGGILAAAFAGCVYLWLLSQGWHK